MLLVKLLTDLLDTKQMFATTINNEPVAGKAA